MLDGPSCTTAGMRLANKIKVNSEDSLYIGVGIVDIAHGRINRFSRFLSDYAEEFLKRACFHRKWLWQAEWKAVLSLLVG